MAAKGMSRVTLQGLLAHKLRLTLAALSIVLGLAFVSGTLVLTDTIRPTFDELISQVLANVDVTVRAKSGFGAADTSADTSADTARDLLPEILVDTVKAVPGVKEAEGTVGGYAQIVTPDGEAITTSGAPTLGFNWSMVPDPSSLKLRTGGRRNATARSWST